MSQLQIVGGVEPLEVVLDGIFGVPLSDWHIPEVEKDARWERTRSVEFPNLPVEVRCVAEETWPLDCQSVEVLASVNVKERMFDTRERYALYTPSKRPYLAKQVARVITVETTFDEKDALPSRQPEIGGWSIRSVIGGIPYSEFRIGRLKPRTFRSLDRERIADVEPRASREEVLRRLLSELAVHRAAQS